MTTKRARAAAACLVLVAACFDHHAVTVTGAELHRHLGSLRDRGVATVDASDEVRDGSTAAIQERVWADQSVFVAGRNHPISDLFDDCADLSTLGDAVKAKHAPCELVARQRQAFELRRYTEFLPGATAATVLAFGAIGGIGFGVGATQDTTSKQIEYGALAGLGAALVVGIVAMFMTCRGKWGGPGCHD